MSDSPSIYYVPKGYKVAVVTKGRAGDSNTSTRMWDRSFSGFVLHRSYNASCPCGYHTKWLLIGGILLSPAREVDEDILQILDEAEH